MIPVVLRRSTHQQKTSVGKFDADTPICVLLVFELKSSRFAPLARPFFLKAHETPA